MKHKTYRAAVIGCGWRGRDHILAYRQIENAECVACCAPSPTKREALAGEFGIKAYSDAEEMIRAEKPDIVHGARQESGRCFTTEEAFGENWTWEQAEFHKAMFAWLEDDARPAGTNLKRSLHEWAVVLALYQSALERRPVSMADFHPPLDLVDQYKAAVLTRTPDNDQRCK